MTKLATVYECRECGSQYPKWEGKCRGCGKWGTLETTVPGNQAESLTVSEKIEPASTLDFKDVRANELPRLQTKIKEFDRVLGGGIIPGSLVLIGGEPGIGKSTLLLQVISAIAKNDIEGDQLLYVSGEESATQVKSRFDRLNLGTADIKFTSETVTEKICATTRELKPKLSIIDSIQTVRSLEVASSAGSQNQVTVSTTKLMEVAKTLNVAIIIIGHITKQGLVAGPKTLEHLVDTVLYLEGDRHHFYRLLRSVKNRFGSVDEVGIFEMTDLGLKEVSNPSLAFLSEANSSAAGTVTTVIMEGSRPLLVEIQALTNKSYFGYPKRTTSGFKKSRLELLIAILSKLIKLPLGQFDVYLNVAGGLKISEPAADLAAAVAIISSFRDTPLPPKTCVFGEVGLGGEVRPVAFAEKRLREAENLGFLNVICPKTKEPVKSKLKILGISNINEISKLLS